MAGAGWRTWTRERLSIPLMQTYLQDQVVGRFASAAARAAVITSPTEGMITTLDDTNQVMRHDGGAWRDVRDQDVKFGVVAAEYDIPPGGNQGFSGATLTAPYVGCVMRAELRAQIRYITPSGQTATVITGLIGGTELQSDADVAERIGQAVSGETSYLLNRVTWFTVTAPTVTVGWNLAAGTGGTDVLVRNPRTYVTGPYRSI